MTSSIFKKVNNFEVKPLVGKGETKTWKYKDVWSCPYIICFLLAPRGSGKTTVLWNILSQVGGKKGQIYIFSGTLNNDMTLKAMIKKLEKNDIKVCMQTDLGLDDDEDNNMMITYKPTYVDKLDQIYGECQGFVEKNYKKLEKEKYLYPITILIFDDMSAYLKNNHTLAQMAKNGRHLKLII